MAKLAFCGLGRMGEAMARRLLEAGHDLTVWNRTPDKAAALVHEGARRADTPSAAAAGADAVFTMVADPAALADVVFGEGDAKDGGLAAGLGPDTVLVDMSTVGPGAVRQTAERLPAGVDMLDAPVLGSVPQATEGTLEIFVGGSAETWERWRPVLEHLGRPTHFGPLGSGAAMKLVANLTLGALMTALAEALALADRLGLDQGAVLDALAGSPIGPTVTSTRSRIESGEYPPNFALYLAAKDLRLVTQAAGAGGLDLKAATVARACLDAAEDAGLGDQDYSAVIAHIRGQRVPHRS